MNACSPTELSGNHETRVRSLAPEETALMKRNERRVNKRIPAKYTINYIDQGDYLISFSKDISVGGMFLYTENPPPIGDCPELSFSIGELRDVKVRSRVVWVKQTPSPQDRGIAVQFIDPPPYLTEAIMQLVSRLAVLEPEANA
jgi:c-di-GMP-binding flagellar brake protein YcgR